MQLFAGPLAIVADALESLGIDYFVGGSVSAVVHGEIRLTQDADVVVHVPPDRILALCERLDPTFFLDRELLRSCFARNMSCNAIHRSTGFKVDLFPLKQRPFSLSEMQRARHFEVLPGLRLRVATAEDCILSKLEWYEKADRVSERQWRDVLGVLKQSRATLDRAYLERWATELGLRDLLQRAIVEAGI